MKNKSLAHDSAEKHTSGEAIYVDDIKDYPHQLHCYFYKSEQTHAEILSIDISEAKKIPDVIDIITAKDVIGKLDIAPVFDGDPLLAKEKIEFFGQPVAAVAAKNIKAAKQALKKIKVKYKPLPAILSAKEAYAKDSFFLKPLVIKRGDAKKAIQQAEYKIKGEFSIGGQDHFYLETQASLAIPTEDGVLVYSSTQNPTEIQKLVAEVLALPMRQVLVETRRMGGGFGGKETQAAQVACLASLFAYRNKRPVKMRLSRFDDMVSTGKRHSFNTFYEVGFNKKGVIQGIEIKLLSDCGYSLDLSAAILSRALLHSDNCYFFKNIKVSGYLCKTNKVSNTAFRGFGGPQGMLNIENILDEIACYLRKDPLIIREKNLYKKGDSTHYGQEISNNRAKELITQIKKSSQYEKRLKKIKTFNKNSPYSKKGIALSPVKFGISFTVNFLNQAGALLHIYNDGSIHLNHGGTEMGQGLFIKIAQVIAEEFQVPLEKIQITATRTDKVPNTSATAASAGTDLNGQAAKEAAQTIKKRMVAFASEYFQISIKKIIFKNDNLCIGKKKIPFADFIHLCYTNRISLSSTGFYKTPKIHFDSEKGKGRPFYYFAYGVAVSEAWVDLLTGEYKILQTDILHDVGNSINPAIDLGQVEGGFIQGLGWLTSEEVVWDDKGRLLTAGPATYKIPTIGDLPEIFHTRLYTKKNEEATIYHSKAVGEPPLMLANSAWLAIKNAISSIANDKRVSLNVPATPVEVFRAICALEE